MGVRVELWSDGSGGRSGHPIGYAWVLLAVDEDTGVVVRETRGEGTEIEGTSNRAELLAVIHGLMQLRFRSRVRVVTDSEYVARNATHSLPMWLQTNWRLTSAPRQNTGDRTTMCPHCGQAGNGPMDMCVRHGAPVPMDAPRDGRMVANRDLWIALADQIANHHEVIFEHVKGHAGFEYNEDCDRRAGAARKALVAQIKAAEEHAA